MQRRLLSAALDALQNYLPLLSELAVLADLRIHGKSTVHAESLEEAKMCILVTE